jgi:tetratricopeptide (TPR) repeat protein
MFSLITKSITAMTTQPKTHKYTAGQSASHRSESSKSTSYQNTSYQSTAHHAAQHVSTAKSLFAEKQYHEALNEYKTALRYTPADYSIYLSIARTYIATGRNTLALTYFYQAGLIALRQGHLDYAELMLKNIFAFDKSSREYRLLKRDITDVHTAELTRQALTA